MTSHDEPTLDELLGDPTTKALMTADDVDPLALEAMLRSVARAIASRSDASVLRDACRASESRVRSQQPGAR
jgi:hypothetical protein